MSKKLNELRDLRGTLVAQTRAILDKAETEKRALTIEEEGQYNDLFKKQDETRASIQREEKQAEAERDAAAETLRNKDTGREQARGGAVDPETRTTGARGTEEYRAAFSKLLRGGASKLNEAEVRALSADSDPSGGFTVAPEQFVDQLIRKVDDMTFIRARATKFRLPTAASMGAPSLDANPDDADWTSELATGNEDTGMTFGKRELHPRPLAKRVKISKKLLQMSPSMEALVRDRLAYKFGITQEKAFLLGTGANQPLGIFTASVMGIPTSRDVATSNNTTAPTMDGLISAKYALKPQYWNKADWLFHRDVLAVVSKLKDGEGQYMWRQSVLANEPDTLLGRPIMMSEYAPNTLTTGLYVGALGDFSQYWIADAVDLQIQALIELYAETNQNGYIGRMESDGMPVLAEAFVRVKLG